ncbi:MAG: peptide chain release factor 1 [Acidobacteria bacterium]|nr:peptide chain release factor 1 [Acidobacteriota bacterium]
MFEKVASIEEKYNELTNLLSDPSVIGDPTRYHKFAKAHSELREVVGKYHDYRSLKKALEDTRQVLDEVKDDLEMRKLAEGELRSLEGQLARCEEELKVLLLPRDPNDERNVLLEIRAGTGGAEASLFAQEVFRMYCRFAERQGWRVEVISAHPSEVGGLKEVIASIEGERVYSKLKYESGVHRVQRVPETEASGRIHTSAVTVAVLPEPDEVEVAIDPREIRVDTFCSSGPGGQSVNTTYSAVRITHLPTGLVVSCQDEKSQIKNRAKALRVLRSRLYDLALQEQQREIAQTRRQQVGSGDRSEKIRTYNFPQNRLTDHRIGMTLHRLDQLMKGEIDEIIDALVTHFQAERLKNEAIA